LAPDKEIARLATEYLMRQRKLWADVVNAGLLPEPTVDVIDQMVSDLKSRHRTGYVDPVAIQPFLQLCSKLGGNYDRYSCDNSSPLSIVDQMVKALDKARQEDRFIPWGYILCDYSVSGLDSARQGYSSYKRILESADHWVETTYIDDFTRASRDELEWWRLAALSKRLQKRMIGASDGFDLSSPHWDIHITLFGLLSRLFIKSLRQKVLRGMQGAARRRTVLGKLSLGFTRCLCRDDAGNPMLGADGRPTYRPCIDPKTSEYRLLLYELFVQKNWSYYRIAKYFNQHRIDDCESWSELTIKNLLWNPDSIGVFIWNRKRREFDYEAEKYVIVENPKSQWIVWYDRNLAIVPMDLWRAARRKIAATRKKSPLTGKKPTRNQISASTLFSGTLFCDYCDHELTLYRSTGRYKVIGCINGRVGAHNCKLTTSKSTRIIETCLLTFIKDHLLTEAAVDRLVQKANAFLAEESKKPRVSTMATKREIQRLEAAIKKLFMRIEREDDQDLCDAYDKRIKDHQCQMQQLRAELRQAEARNEPPPPPLDKARIRAYLADIRGLLNQEIPAAAETIRRLTGPIKIHQDRALGQKRGAKWIATFCPDLLRLLASVARTNGYPDSITLEYLSAANWIIPETAEILIEHTPKYERIAEDVKELIHTGASIHTVAAVMRQTWKTVRQAFDFAETGKRPKTKPPGRRTGRRSSGQPKYVAVAADVVRLRNEELLSFARIGKRLGISTATAVRAYDYACPSAVQVAATSGQMPRRGAYSHIGPTIYGRIKAAVEAGQRPSEIARTMGCGQSTVYRVMRKCRNVTNLYQRRVSR
jgi:DNA invertase Pin-like site-specific DNA recombinase